MNLPITAKINSKGNLTVGGCDLTDLARKFGTPLYVVDEKTLRENCRLYKSAFKGYKNTRIIFASKALCTKGILKVIDSEGLGVDVSSGGELFTAVQAGCDPKLIYFHGNNKTEEEIILGIKSRVGCFVVDNFDELSLIDLIAKKMKKQVSVMFRVNPGIEAHTHEFIKTGLIDSKFGFSKDFVMEAVNMVRKSKYLNFKGLHSHIGSQISDVAPYVAEIEVLFKIASNIEIRFEMQCEEINIGGGIGIVYTEKDFQPNIKNFAHEIVMAFANEAKKHTLKTPRLVLEPGRSIVGQAGVTIYKVGVIKRIPGIRTYVIVDGGMGDNPRPIIYGAKYKACLANKPKAKCDDLITLAGRACESGDVLIKDIAMPKPEKGDIVAVACTGAYNYAMASNYNRVPRPAMVMVNSGRAKLIVKRESYQDMTRNDI